MNAKQFKGICPPGPTPPPPLGKLPNKTWELPLQIFDPPPCWENFRSFGSFFYFEGSPNHMLMMRHLLWI